LQQWPEGPHERHLESHFSKAVESLPGRKLCFKTKRENEENEAYKQICIASRLRRVPDSHGEDWLKGTLGLLRLHTFSRFFFDFRDNITNKHKHSNNGATPPPRQSSEAISSARHLHDFMAREQGQWDFRLHTYGSEE
jgi:hypothetical protein